ncbi:hypothetical protein EDB86DRAFT_2977733, partial [Lactarius hatsudake]
MHCSSCPSITSASGFIALLDLCLYPPLGTSHSPVHVPHTIPTWLLLVWGCMGGTLLGLCMGLGPHAPLCANSSR